MHIADVTAFLHQGSELDQVAQERATSVYLVQRVTAAHTDTHTHAHTHTDTCTHMHRGTAELVKHVRYTHPLPLPPGHPNAAPHSV